MEHDLLIHSDHVTQTHDPNRSGRCGPRSNPACQARRSRKLKDDRHRCILLVQSLEYVPDLPYFSLPINFRCFFILFFVLWTRARTTHWQRSYSIHATHVAIARSAALVSHRSHMNRITLSLAAMLIALQPLEKSQTDEACMNCEVGCYVVCPISYRKSPAEVAFIANLSADRNDLNAADFPLQRNENSGRQEQA